MATIRFANSSRKSLAGFQNNFYKAQIMAGTVLCVLLALVLDLVLAGVGRLLTPWLRGRSAR